MSDFKVYPHFPEFDRVGKDSNSLFNESFGLIGLVKLIKYPKGKHPKLLHMKIPIKLFRQLPSPLIIAHLILQPHPLNLGPSLGILLRQ